MATARVVTPGLIRLDRERELMPHSPWSNRARAIIVRVGTEVPCERGPALVALLTGLPFSVSTMRAITDAAGGALVAGETTERDRIMRTLRDAPAGAPAQQVSVDGAMVPLVGGVWREARTLAVGVIETTGTGERHTSALSSLSRMTDAERFSDVAIGEIHRRGTEHARVVVAVADGAGWCQQLFDDHVPSAVWMLDFPHAVAHLSAAAQAVYGSGTAATSERLGTQRHALLRGDPDTVLAAIAALPIASAADPTEAERVRERALAYWTTRRSQIDYARFVAAGLPIGSGVVERASTLVVEARLKGAGMHWAAAHVDPMLALRCALWSDRWNEGWRALTRQLSAVPVSMSPSPSAPKPAQITSPPSGAMPPPVARPRPVPKVVNGRPTNDHYWKRGFNLRNPTSRDADC